MRPAPDGTTSLSGGPLDAEARSLCHAALLMLRMFEAKPAADCQKGAQVVESVAGVNPTFHQGSMAAVCTHAL